MTGADRLAAIAAQIVGYRRDGNQIAADAPAWEIASEDDANLIQDLVAAEIAEPVAGWKIGAVDAAGKERLGLTQPFIGRAFLSRVWQSPAILSASLLPQCIPESEIAFRLGGDLPVRTAPYSFDEVVAVLESCHPAFEIVDFSWWDRGGLQGRDFVADNGCCAGLVIGPPIPDWRARELQGISIELCFDSQIVARGNVAQPLRVLLERLTWLANHLSGKGVGMSSGQYVATGNWTGMKPMFPGQHAVARFGELGSVECTLPREDAWT